MFIIELRENIYKKRESELLRKRSQGKSQGGWGMEGRVRNNKRQTDLD